MNNMVVLPFGLKSSQARDSEISTDANNCAELSFSSDAFSSKVTLPGDPHFYVRAEMAADGAIVFTDFNGGAEPPVVLGIAITHLLSETSSSSTLIFRDIHPTWQDDPSGKVELERRIRFLKEALSDGSESVLRGRELRVWQDRGKVCASLEFS